MTHFCLDWSGLFKDENALSIRYKGALNEYKNYVSHIWLPLHYPILTQLNAYDRLRTEMSSSALQPSSKHQMREYILWQSCSSFQWVTETCMINVIFWQVCNGPTLKYSILHFSFNVSPMCMWTHMTTASTNGATVGYVSTAVTDFVNTQHCSHSMNSSSQVHLSCRSRWMYWMFVAL